MNIIKQYADLFAHKIVSVQPMSSPVGLAYALFTRFREMEKYLSKINVDAYDCNLKNYKKVTKL